MKEKRTYRRQTINEERQVAIALDGRNESVEACSRCKKRSLMFLPDIVSVILQMSTREIYRRIEAGTAHFVESDDQQLLVCIRSLDQEFEIAAHKLEPANDRHDEEAVFLVHSEE
ncbi:MAG: hypothetical protein HKN33_07750 [Pyrinomonadaceae bacterium]|nr:hypothetical protein [Pyrinomonadaceae bacterium]